MKERSTPIKVEVFIERTVDEVWDAITERDQMILWFFESIPNFKAEVGFTTEFPVHVEERTFTHIWKITEVIPLQRIVYRWSYEEYSGEGLVYFDIADEGKHTKLTLTNVGLETFPRDIPEFSRESCQGGWDYFIKERLANYLS